MTACDEVLKQDKLPLLSTNIPGRTTSNPTTKHPLKTASGSIQQHPKTETDKETSMSKPTDEGPRKNSNKKRNATRRKRKEMTETESGGNRLEAAGLPPRNHTKNHDNEGAPSSQETTASKTTTADDKIDRRNNLVESLCEQQKVHV
jgi:hypothetical protein